MKYSIVVPIYNEEENVRQLHSEIVQTMRATGELFEIIFVNDGSSDGTLDILQTLVPLTTITFRKNFGQTAAMDAGIKHARGEFIITMDGDGQNPPGEIPKLIAAQQEGGYDIISGWRHKRKDPFLKRFVSRGANALRSIFVKDQIHDSGCSLKLYRRECFENVDLFGEMHRFIVAVLSWSGYTVGEVAVEHRPRTAGTTKYGWKRIVKGFVDMISIWFWRKYAMRPLHLFGSLSFALTGSGVALLIYLFIRRVILHISLMDSNLPLLAVLITVLGVQFFVSGIIIDLSIKQIYSGKHMHYAIKTISRNDRLSYNNR